MHRRCSRRYAKRVAISALLMVWAVELKAMTIRIVDGKVVLTPTFLYKKAASSSHHFQFSIIRTGISAYSRAAESPSVIARSQSGSFLDGSCSKCERYQPC